ncbi:Six-hairpin glycosidase-like protein [Rhypophila decipiens]
MFRICVLVVTVAGLCSSEATIPVSQRRSVVRSFNVKRNASSDSTPLQVGNGNFAFGADITGLQTFKPYAILSTWGWHNFSLPTAPGQTSIDDFTGLQWWTHDRLVTYNQPNPGQNDISTWLIQNPQRLNLGNIGFSFDTSEVTENDLQNKTQELDLWAGKLSSSFVYNGSKVDVETWADPDSDSIAVTVESDLLLGSQLGLFIDFPYPNRLKFNAPFVGVWNETDRHETTCEQTSPGSATIRHHLGQTTYFVTLKWNIPGLISGPSKGTHRYLLSAKSKRLELTATFTPDRPPHDREHKEVEEGAQTAHRPLSNIPSASRTWWSSFWSSGAFIDLSSVTSNPNTTELQRRIVLSQYLLAVNSASYNPPQESGLVNNGWYGKFHLEMILWNSLPFARWNHFPLLWRSLPDIYKRFLPSSITRARDMGYSGARWGKMTDPTGRSAPGEINSLLIWQQPHPMYFAETEYRSFPNRTTLGRWDDIITETADYMASYAYFNSSTGVYDLGPPMYPVSENTNPNATLNPTFELAYWRFGLDIAIRWKSRLNQTIPPAWLVVRDNIAPLPVINNTYAVYEGIPQMWTDNATVNDHPAMAGIYGLLPPPASGPPLNLTILQNTAAKIHDLWLLEESYGWDFAMLAMNSLRLGDAAQAIEYLLHPIFQFDDAGYPVGGSRVPTPYFPNSAGLLLAMAMMAGGWDGAEGKKHYFPAGWEAVEVDGFVKAM